LKLDRQIIQQVIYQCLLLIYLS